MRSHTNVREDAHQAEQMARGVATGTWMSRLARLGYATKGVVYLIIGGLAAHRTSTSGYRGPGTDRLWCLFFRGSTLSPRRQRVNGGTYHSHPAVSLPFLLGVKICFRSTTRRNQAPLMNGTGGLLCRSTTFFGELPPQLTRSRAT